MKHFLFLFSLSFALLLNNMVWAADFNTCAGPYPYFIDTSNPADDRSDVYTFPQVVTCNVLDGISDVQLFPSDAGTVTSVECSWSNSGCQPKVHVRWTKGGVHSIKVTYGCGGLGNTDRTRTVSVTMNGVNHAAFTLTNINTCPSPGTSFTINRTNSGTCPVLKHWVDVFEVDATGVYNGGLWYSTNWINGNVTTKTISATANSINFVVGKRYKVKLAVQTECSGWQEQISSTILIKDCKPVATVIINSNTTSIPLDLYACNNSPMAVVNQSSVPLGGTAITQMRFTLYNSTGTCPQIGTVAGGPFNVAQSGVYDLRALFPAAANTPGTYKLVAEANNTYGWGTAFERCLRINAAVVSNADFKFVGSPTISGGLPINRTPLTDFNGAEVGQLSLGITLSDIINLSAVDWYKVQIWETNPTTGANINTILTSAQLLPPLPSNYAFNDPIATNGYFFNLTQANVIAKRFKVRLTVSNECGTTFQESYFRIRPACQFCKTENLDLTTSVSTYPNPAAEQIVFAINAPNNTNGNISIINLMGKEVGTLSNLGLNAGNNTVNFDCLNLPVGIYLYSFTDGRETIVGKFVKK